MPLDGTVFLARKIQIDSSVTTDSTSTTTGAVIISGGIGLAKNLYVGATGIFSGTVDSTSSTTGSLVVGGGMGVAKNLYGGMSGSFDTVITRSTVNSTSTSTGSITTSGGLGIAKSMNIGGTINSITVPSGKTDTFACLTDIDENSWGKIWSPIAGLSALSKTWNYISMSDNGVYMLACATDSLYLSINSGKTFTAITPTGGAANWKISCITPAGEYMFIINTAVDTNNLYLSTDKGTTWTAKSLTGTLGSVLDCSSDGKYVYCAAGGIVYRSDDYGATWTTFKNYSAWGSIYVSHTGKYVFLVVNNGGYADSYYYDNYCVSDSPKQSIGVFNFGYMTGWMCKSGRVALLNSSAFGDYWYSEDYGATTHTAPCSDTLPYTIAVPYTPFFTSALQGGGCGSYNAEKILVGDGKTTIYPNRDNTGGLTLKSLGCNFDGTLIVAVNTTTGNPVMSRTNFVINPSLGLSIVSTDNSSSTLTGALQIAGGASIAKNLYAGATGIFSGTVDSTTTATGTLVIGGGVGIAKKLFATDLEVFGTEDKMVVIRGGNNNRVGIKFLENTGDDKWGTGLFYGNNTDASTLTVGSYNNSTTLTSQFEIAASSGNTKILSTTASTLATTGALCVAGGVGIATTTDAVSATNGGGLTCAGGGAFNKNLYVGGTTCSTSTSTGSLMVAGGLGVGCRTFTKFLSAYNGVANRSEFAKQQALGLTALSVWSPVNLGTGLTTWSNLCWSPELGIFCAVSSTGGVATSTNGITWISRTASAANAWRGVCWSSGLGLFCAVANSGTDRVMVSPDGIVWTAKTPEADAWTSVCWSPENGRFCAVGTTAGKNVMTSVDGTTWIVNAGVEDTTWVRVCWSPELNMFCAIATRTGSSNKIMTSPTGLTGTWTIRTTGVSVTYNYYDICWSPELGMFCGIGDRNITSTDGITWTETANSNGGEWRGICWSPELGIFCSMIANGTWSMTSTKVLNNRVNMAPNAIQFFTNTTDTSSTSTGAVIISGGIGLAKNLYVGATGIFSGTVDSTTTSTGTLVIGGGVGIAKSVYGGMSGSFDSVIARGTTNSSTTATGSLIVGGGVGVAKNLYVGATGIFSGTVDATTTATGTLVIGGGVGIGKSLYVGGPTDSATTSTGALSIVGGASIGKNLRTGSVFDDTGTDSVYATWVTKTVSPTSLTWNAMCWSSELNLFVAVSGNGTTNSVITSPDGNTWTSQVTPGSSYNYVCWSPELKMFCAVGSNTIMTSFDGITWYSQTVPEANAWSGVCWSPQLGKFCAVATTGTNRVMTSTTGLSWGTVVVNAGSWTRVTWSPTAGGTGLFVAVSTVASDTNVVMYSTNGTSWSYSNTSPKAILSNVCWSTKLNLFVTPGYNTSNAFTSPDGNVWTTQTLLTSTLWQNVIACDDLGMIYILGNSTTATYSFDCVTWSNTTVPSGNYLAGTWSPELKIFASIAYNSNKPIATTTTTSSVYKKTNLSKTRIFDTSDSYTTYSGALTVAGGVGIAKSVYGGMSGSFDSVIARGTTNSSTTATGSLIVGGGAGVAQNLYVGATGVFSGTVDSTTTATGTLVIGGGVGIAKKLYVGSNMEFHGTNSSVLTGPSVWYFTDADSVPVRQDLNYTHDNMNIFFDRYYDGAEKSASATATSFGISKYLSNLKFTYAAPASLGTAVSGITALNINGSGVVSIPTTTPTTLATTGALVVSGGVGIDTTTEATSSTNGGGLTVAGGASIAKKLFVGGVISGSNNIWGSGLVGMKNGSNYGPYFEVAGSKACVTAGTQGVGYSTLYVRGDCPLQVDNTTASTLSTTGALVCMGGVGIGGTTDATSATNGGSLTVAGGVGIAKSVYGGMSGSFDSVIARGTTNSSTTATGSLIVGGGVGIAKSLYVGATGVFSGTVDSTTTATGTLVIGGGMGIAKRTNTKLLSTYNNPAIRSSFANQTLGTRAVSTWTTQATLAGNYWNNVCWSPELGLFCAVSSGPTGLVTTSSDGITWTTRAAAENNCWKSVCWSPELGLFCAVAYSGSGNRVMTSPDGITWTTRASAEDNSWRSVCWSPELGLFCSVAGDGTSGHWVMTSPDGITWTTRASAADNDWRSICWSPELGLFCAVAYLGTNRVMTSPNGTAWTTQTVTAYEWQSICWSPELGLFCAVGSTTGHAVTTSPDGINWTAQTASDNYWVSVCWSPEFGLFCAVANEGTSGTVIMTSPDGSTWQTRVSIANNYWDSVCWSPELGIFCAVTTDFNATISTQVYNQKPSTIPSAINRITNTTVSSTTSTGALVVSGGMGIAKNLYVGATGVFGGTVDSTSTSTGSLVIGGGAGIAKNLYVGSLYLPTSGGTPTALTYYQVDNTTLASSLMVWDASHKSTSPFAGRITRIGNVVSVSWSHIPDGTSLAQYSATIADALPTWARPSVTVYSPHQVISSGSWSSLGAMMINTNGVIAIYYGSNSVTNWPVNSTCGIVSGTVSYSI